jgi:hypothetical protein
MSKLQPRLLSNPTAYDAVESTSVTLPPTDTVRWVVRRKAKIVAAVQNGQLSPDEACARYNLSMEELESWLHLMHAHGLKGLQTTRANQYREPVNKKPDIQPKRV